MIENIGDLAKEAGSRATTFKIQMNDIQQSIKDHTEGDVWARFTREQVAIHSNISPASERLVYPFTSETFWKAVEYVQEEGLDWDEEDEEEISMSYTDKVARTAPHEHYN